MDKLDIFTRGVWAYIPSDDETSWVKKCSEVPRSNDPLGDYGYLIKSMLSKGVSEQDIARFAKLVGYETAFGVCYHLEDSNASYENFDDSAERIVWGVFEVDSLTGDPRGNLGGAHERLLQLDPSGRDLMPTFSDNESEQRFPVNESIL